MAGVAREFDFLCWVTAAELRIVAFRGLTTRDKSMNLSLILRRFCTSVSMSTLVDVVVEGTLVRESLLGDEMEVEVVLLLKDVSNFLLVVFIVVNIKVQINCRVDYTFEKCRL